MSELLDRLSREIVTWGGIRHTDTLRHDDPPIVTLLQDAKFEIERLTADNEKQRIAAGQTSDEWRALHKELRGEQEENERMKAQLYDAGIDYSTMASEIERLTAENERLLFSLNDMEEKYEPPLD